MDAFFASVEQLDNPDLRGRPIVVGSPPDARGVVATCSYEARRFGIHSAMPSRTAGRLCPHAVFIRPRMARYRAASERIFRVVRRFSPLVEPLSIDEAFLDITGSAHLHGGPVNTARALKRRIIEETGLVASVGVAPNKFLAKLASDMDKPDGLAVTPFAADTIRDFLAPLPVRRIWGVGVETEKRLAARGLHSIGDVQRSSEADLTRCVGPEAARRLHALACGRDDRAIQLTTEEKSISHETTFDHDRTDWHGIERVLAEQAERVGRRLRRSGKVAATAVLKLRWSDFITLTRQLPLQPPTDHDAHLISAARELLARVRADRPVRLVGFGVTALQEPLTAPPRQVSFELFAESATRRDARLADLDRALDQIRDRFGPTSIRRGMETG